MTSYTRFFPSHSEVWAFAFQLATHFHLMKSACEIIDPTAASGQCNTWQRT